MTDEQLIGEMLYERDIAAFAAADWSAVEGDFAPDAFVGYSMDVATGTWQIAFPDLAGYGQDWLRQARAMQGTEPDQIVEQLRSISRIADVSIRGDRALVRKEFDGDANGPDGLVHLCWTTYYFLSRTSGRWQITGFVGYLPTPDGRLSVL
ncbi:MAG: hypothetical protein BGO26_16110 [Actinobacteria bacterium 69-20]|nr:hypothetical protein [Actinomycetota bacterium]OJV27819.1 MAG: hypothetical protein BGO26_16110 [Actinobacteria bacterium 69-20]